MNLEILIKDLHINARNITTIKNNVFLIETESGEKFILKTRRTQSKNNYSDSHRFDNEVRIYKCLAHSNFRFLNTPQLIQSAKDSIVIEYIEKCNKLEINAVADEDFINSYIELQSLEVKPDFWFDLKHQHLRGFFYQGVLVPLFSLSKKISLNKVLRIIYLFLQLSLTSKKLKRRYWLHGDLTSSNVFYNQKDDKLYFIDFENIFYTRKWMLNELIERCIELKEGQFSFNYKNLLLYKQNALLFKDDLENIDLKKQVRFSLLLTCISNIVVTKSNEKREIFIKFIDTVLDAGKFNLWYQLNLKTDAEQSVSLPLLSGNVS